MQKSLFLVLAFISITARKCPPNCNDNSYVTFHNLESDLAELHNCLNGSQKILELLECQSISEENIELYNNSSITSEGFSFTQRKQMVDEANTHAANNLPVCDADLSPSYKLIFQIHQIHSTAHPSYSVTCQIKYVCCSEIE